MILDKISTTDGHEIFWVHDNSSNTIHEDDLWYCEHNLQDWLTEQIAYEKISVDDICNYIEDTIDLVEIHKDILLESHMYVIKEDTDDFFRGMEEEEMIELAEKCVEELCKKDSIKSKTLGDIILPRKEDFNIEEDFISILEDNGYEVEQ